MCDTDATTPFATTFGEELYAFLAHEREAAERYDRGIDAFTRHEARRFTALGERSTLGGARNVLDVGGGCGAFLFELLRQWPGLRGTLLDRPEVIERARLLVPPECTGRIAFVAGDFHAAVPTGHDRIVLKHVLHNWDEEQAAALLTRCARALDEGGRVLVVETLLSPEPRADMAQLLDLEMRVLTGGFVRRKPQLRRLFGRANLAIERVERLGPSCLLVGAPRRA
jgi:ubiquinone/menaquinone biosynthesis C-methylase UbiE